MTKYKNQIPFTSKIHWNQGKLFRSLNIVKCWFEHNGSESGIPQFREKISYSPAILWLRVELTILVRAQIRSFSWAMQKRCSASIKRYFFKRSPILTPNWKDYWRFEHFVVRELIFFVWCWLRLYLQSCNQHTTSNYDIVWLLCNSTTSAFQMA